MVDLFPEPTNRELEERRADRQKHCVHEWKERGSIPYPRWCIIEYKEECGNCKLERSTMRLVETPETALIWTLRIRDYRTIYENFIESI